MEGLKANGPLITDASLVTTFNTKIVNLDIGIGTLLNFSSTNHQASHTVWGSRIAADGTFTVPLRVGSVNLITPGSG